jgi:hypothetical protein
MVPAAGALRLPTASSSRDSIQHGISEEFRPEEVHSEESGSLQLSLRPAFWHWKQLKSEMRSMLQPLCRKIVKSRTFQAIMFCSLLAALFLPDFSIIIDQKSNIVIDVLLTCVLVLFLAELSVQAIGYTRTYWGSFFFWMDLLGAMSLLLDLSYIPVMWMLTGGNAGSLSDNVIIMRAARVAKLGARAGRFTKLVKLMRFLPGASSRHQVDDSCTAKVISAQLVAALSTRIACLIIIMVMIMPLFSMWSFPDQDWSPISWTEILEDIGRRKPEHFQAWVDQFQQFYNKKTYSPYWMSANFPGVNGIWEFASPHGKPQRSLSSVRTESKHLVIDFNFTEVYRWDAIMSLALMFFIMILMVVFSLMLTNSVSKLVLRPLENLLQKVKTCASKIFDSVTDMANMISSEDTPKQDIDEDDDAARGFDNETALLARVIDKLAVLSQMWLKKGMTRKPLKALMRPSARSTINM